MIDIKPLLKELPAGESARLKILYNGAVKAMREYKDDSTERKLRDWQAAESALNDAFDLASASKNQDSERFKTRKKALDWLKDNGHKVSTGKFYQDCSNGFPIIGPDGSLSKYQVLTYGLDLSKKNEVDLTVINNREYVDRKNKADAEMAEMKAERMRREEDRLWVHADEAWSVVAGLVGTLRDSIRHHIYKKQREIVETAAGSQDRSQEVFEYVEDIINGAFNEVAGESIDIKFEEGNDEG